MTPVQLRFRSSPNVELKQLDDLAPEDRERFRELESDPEFYGLFVPKPPQAMNVKSVSRQGAELFQSLATPRSLDADDDLVDLVLDGILEVESGDRFVRGAEALAVVVRPSTRVREIDGLSMKALLHAQDLETDDPQALAMALYRYNRIPMTASWKAAFGDVLAHVGADRGSLRALLDRDWIAGGGDGKGWHNWSPRTPSHRGADDVTYKLYVSPRPERVREAFEAVVRVLSGFPETPFKIGEGASGLLRPDKLVAYFPTWERMDEVAAEVQRELAGCDAHGVPFAAQIDRTGLLAWGVDPPESERLLKWTGPRSWRLWIAQRLGGAFAIAKQTWDGRAEAAPHAFAIERVRRLGVDVETWTPYSILWTKR